MPKRIKTPANRVKVLASDAKQRHYIPMPAIKRAKGERKMGVRGIGAGKVREVSNKETFFNSEDAEIFATGKREDGFKVRTTTKIHRRRSGTDVVYTVFWK